MRFTAALTAACCLTSFCAIPAGATDLLEIYQLALENDPLLLEAEANRSATLENKPQAIASLLPALRFDGQLDREEAVSTGARQGFVGGPLVSFNQPSDANRYNWALELRQPIFNWASWVALKRADKTVAQAEADVEAARQELGVRVAQRYFNVLAARDTLEAEQANKEAIARQLEQAETRFEVGLIAITDVYESRAAYDQSVATEIEARRTLATARELLREITGSYARDLAAPGDDLPLLEPEPADQDRWVEQALAQNLNVESSRLAVEIAEQDIRSQRSGHMPEFDLVLRRSEFDSTAETGTVDQAGNPITLDEEFNSEADLIALQFRVPLYSGGAVSSRVRQAIHQKSAAQQRLERVARETERLARDSYLGVVADISRVTAFKQALVSSETALRATEAGFDVGTRTSVDVLNSRGDLLRAHTNYRRARYDYLLNLTRLKQAAGTLSLDDMQQINAFLSK